jgi:hypothetical protein
MARRKKEKGVKRKVYEISNDEYVEGDSFRTCRLQWRW